MPPDAPGQRQLRPQRRGPAGALGPPPASSPAATTRPQVSAARVEGSGGGQAAAQAGPPPGSVPVLHTHSAGRPWPPAPGAVSQERLQISDAEICERGAVIGVNLRSMREERRRAGQPV